MSGAPDFLTEAWVRWLDSTLRRRQVPPEVNLVLEHRVTDHDGSVFCWHVTLGSGRAAATAGAAPEGSANLVALSSDRATAEEIATAGKSAQRAFAQGRLHIDGDPLLLLQAREALEAMGTAADSALKPTI